MPDKEVVFQVSVNFFDYIILGFILYLWCELVFLFMQAIEFGYDVEIVEPDTPWRFKVAELAKYGVV